MDAQDGFVLVYSQVLLDPRLITNRFIQETRNKVVPPGGKPSG